MIHTGSRGLGHQVATDFTQLCKKEIETNGTELKDNQLSFT